VPKLRLFMCGTTMEQPSNYHDLAKALCRLSGVAAFLLILFWNPVVLRPRFWTASAVAYSVSVDAALIIACVGLLCLRKWGALAISALALLLLTRMGTGLQWSLILLLPIFFTALVWRALRWGKWRHDLVLALGSIAASGLLTYIAFVMRHA